MPRVVEFELEDGQAISVEVDSSGRGYDFTNVSQKGGKRDNGEENAPRSFNEALQRIRPMANQLINQLRDLAETPDEVAVEFGLKLSGEVGALIASTSTEANFTVKLAWKNRANEQAIRLSGAGTQ